jgi:hypothetical protein
VKTRHRETKEQPEAPGKPPAYLELKQQEKEVSMTKPLFLAALMLFAVVLLSPLVRMVQPKDTKAGLVDDVEEPEFAPAPVLPEDVTFPERETIDLPQLEPDLGPVVTQDELESGASAALAELDFLRDSSGMSTLVLLDSEVVFREDEVDAPAVMEDRETWAQIRDQSIESGRPLEIEVDAEGRARLVPGENLDAFADPEAIERFLQEVRFQPAIRNGVPVPSRLRLGEVGRRKAEDGRRRARLRAKLRHDRLRLRARLF